ncbi:MAG: hypothetical protein ABI068_03760, partial [Ktedonobacterales bacterium]
PRPDHWLKADGRRQIVSLLQQNLQQEEQTAQILEQLTPSLAQQVMQPGASQGMTQQPTTTP